MDVRRLPCGCCKSASMERKNTGNRLGKRVTQARQLVCALTRACGHRKRHSTGYIGAPKSSPGSDSEYSDGISSSFRSSVKSKLNSNCSPSFQLELYESTSVFN